MTGPPGRDGICNAQVCLLCVLDNPEYDGMSPVGCIYRTATEADMIKLTSKFGAVLTEADKAKCAPYLPNSLGLRQLRYGKVNFKRSER